MGMIRGTNVERVERLDPMVAQILRQRTCAERVAMVFDAERAMRQLLDANLRAQFPDWSSQQIEQEIAQRWLRESK